MIWAAESAVWTYGDMRGEDKERSNLSRSYIVCSLRRLSSTQVLSQDTPPCAYHNTRGRYLLIRRKGAPGPSRRGGVRQCQTFELFLPSAECERGFQGSGLRRKCNSGKWHTRWLQNKLSVAAHYKAQASRLRVPNVSMQSVEHVSIGMYPRHARVPYLGNWPRARGR